jgi:hypothetical protein
MAEYEKSGQTMREFCGQNQLSEVQFAYWRRALRDDRRKSSGFVELVRPGTGRNGAGVSIRIDDRMSIVLERGFDETSLKLALAAIAGTKRA